MNIYNLPGHGKGERKTARGRISSGRRDGVRTEGLHQARAPLGTRLAWVSLLSMEGLDMKALVRV